MSEKRIKDYLSSLHNDLGWRGVADRDILIEIESHLLEAVDAGLRQGLNEEQAEQRAIARFGSVTLIANAFAKERMDLMQIMLLAVAILTGLFSVYIDSRPLWDDAGILAGSLLLVSGLLTLLGHRHPWLIALAVGLWIPLHNIYLTLDWTLSFILLIPLVGAYAGQAAHLGIHKLLRPA